jgi:predicted transcriptional regulator
MKPTVSIEDHMRPTLGRLEGVLGTPRESVSGYESGAGRRLRAAEKLEHVTLGNPGTRVDGRKPGSAVNG